MNLAIDIGNSATKAALFDGSTFVRTGEWHEMVEMADGIAICASGKIPHFANVLIKHGKGLVLTHETPVPLKNLYASPETLGMDRLAVAVGGWALYPNQNCLLVDFGTAITVDLVMSDGRYVGGNISAGVNMRLRALHEGTARLPLVNGICPISGRRSVLADSTEDALLLGVLNGITYEIDGYIDTIKQKIGDITVIFTGGDVKLFEKRIKNPIFAGSNLVLIGLNAILEYNKGLNNR